jgi:hypothetical protein
MEPVGEGPTQDPNWEGTFEREGFAYTLTVTSAALAKPDVELALSTIVEVRGAVGGPATEGSSEPTTTPAVGDSPTTTSPTTSSEEFTVPYSEEAEEVEAQVKQAVRDYYEAVDREDWAYTYDHLDSETRATFTEEEWYLKNQCFADTEGLDLSSIDVLVNNSPTDPVVSVTVYRTFKDGTSIGRDTFFVWEDGEWKHRFGQEENKIFMPDTSYEELVEAQ